MGLLTGLGLGAITGAAGNLIGNIGSGKRYKKQTQIQEESQKRLNEQAAELNYTYGEQAADNALERGFQSADYNQGIWEKQFELQNEQDAMKYQTAVSDIEKAGLSYGVLSGGGLGGGGGVGGGGGTPSAGTGAGNQKAARAADAAQQEANRVARQQAQIEALRAGSEIELATAQAEKEKAEAENIREQTSTSKELTPIQKSLTEQQAVSQWIENVKQRFEATAGGGDEISSAEWNSNFGNFEIFKGSYMDEKVASEIAKTWSEASSNKALEQLNTEKKKGYWKELMNATMHAEADKIKAIAQKLSAEWSTGEYTNWKTWSGLATDVVGAIRGIIGITK